ncbi:MAG: zinc ribbon domain-containing protein [Candidatus Marinimicrobia bacterium]|nr:zinc ribbon domain-containing protein [Candidatus Neomarinimicrobiota bacterium]
MPIYDYRCLRCDEVFAALAASSSTPAADITCPDCGQNDAEKLFSMRTALLTGGVWGSTATASFGHCDSGFY